MADNQPLFGGSPAVSPEALKTRRNLAAALQMQGQETSPIRSPWQGVARIAQSMMGGYQGYQADQAELQARQQSAANLAAALNQGNVGGIVGAMSDPFTNPEAAKLAAGLSTPSDIDLGLLKAKQDRFGRIIPGSEHPVQQIVTTEVGGNKIPGLWQGTPGGGAQEMPVNTAPSPTQPAAPPAAAAAPSQPYTGGQYTPVQNNGQPGATGYSTNGPLSQRTQDLVNYGMRMKAEQARQTATAEAGAKAAMDPVAEIMKETKTAPQALNALNIIEDTMRQYGDKITTGPAAEGVLKLKQAVNGLTGTNVLGDTAPAEIIKKLNAQLASASLPAFTNRGTQFDLKVFMENNPGLAQSPQGTLFLTNILKQIHRQNLQLAQIAQDPSSWQNWPALQQKFYQENPILNPLTQRPLGMQADTPQQQGFSRDQLEAEARRRGLLK